MGGPDVLGTFFAGRIPPTAVRHRMSLENDGARSKKRRFRVSVDRFSSRQFAAASFDPKQQPGRFLREMTRESGALVPQCGFRNLP